MRYYFIAGEASGDLHASNLIKEIAKLDKEAVFQGLGGDLMEKQGMKLVRHYRDMAFMGFIPVLMNIRTIQKNFRVCEKDLLLFNPDVLILIDYPGFNLRMAKFAKENGIKVYYYISPKIWAWKTYRVHKIKALVDEMFTIFPFETEFYAQYDYPVNYVGNPLLDAVLEQKGKSDISQFKKENNLDDREVVAIVPGSRKSEISYLLPVMLEAAKTFPEFQYVVTGAPNIKPEFYQKVAGETDLKIVWDKTYEIVENSKAAMVASGTATLEVGILETPQVVCYRIAGGRLFHFFGKIVLKLDWVSLVNIILNKEAVKELIQANFTKKKLIAELKQLLYDEQYISKINQNYKELLHELGKPGASKQAAKKIIEKLKAD